MTDTWRSLGPTRIDSTSIGATGRIMCMAIDPSNGSTIYAGSLSGDSRRGGGCGVWKTTNGGNTWVPIADDLPSLEILDLAIDPTATQRVFAATRNMDREGSGLFRSDNGGGTWTLVTADKRLNGRTLLVNSRDSTIMYMGTRAAVLRSRDGGATWQPVLSDPAGRVTDLVMDPKDPQVLFAGMRAPEASLSVAGVYRTADGGNNWTRLSGCPGQTLSAAAADTEVRLAFSGGVVYAAFKSATAFTLYRTTGIGCSVGGRPDLGWERRWQAPSAIVRTMWSFIYADPADPRFVYVTGTSFRVSTDGGATFAVSQGPHVDHHAFATDPSNAAIIYTGCDGGIYKSTNRGANGSWTFIAEGMTNAEIYDLADAETAPELLIAGTQDNGTVRFAGAAGPWAHIQGGDGATVDIDRTDDQVLYAMGQYASSIGRSVNGAAFQNISSGLPVGSTCFNLHYHVHPRTPTTLLASCQALWRTTTSAPPGAWARIFTPSTGSVVRSAVDPATDVYFAGTSRGEIFAGPGGTGFTRAFGYGDVVTGGGTPAVTDMVMNPDLRRDMYVTFSAKGAGRVMRARRSGAASPQDMTGDLPPDLLVRTIAVDRNWPGTVYVGTSHGGVYRGTSSDDGVTWRWRAYNDGIPSAVDVRRLLPHPRTGVLRAGTFGRGAYEVDTAPPIGSVLAAEGRIAMLRAHDVGTGFGPDWDHIDVEVVARLDSDLRKAFGFQLRGDSQQRARGGMLDVLRDAFNRDARVRVEYMRTGLRNGLALRVIALD